MAFDYKTFDSISLDSQELARYAARMADVIHKDGLCRRDGSALRAHEKKIGDWQYKVAIIAPFETGKSTTFDILCDGREVSPTGLGSRTSTVLSSAITLRMDKKSTPALSGCRMKNCSAASPQITAPALSKMTGNALETLKDLSKIYDLGKSEDREVLSKCLATIDEVSKGKLSSEEKERLDISRMVLKHYAAVSSRRVERHVSLDIARLFTVYPRDWRRDGVNPDNYKADQMTFLFLKQLKLYLNAPTLRHLRAVVVDLPGRGVSPIDDLIARQGVENVAAVIFLLGLGGKEMSKSDIEDLRWLIKDRGLRQTESFLPTMHAQQGR